MKKQKPRGTSSGLQNHVLTLSLHIVHMIVPYYSLVFSVGFSAHLLEVNVDVPVAVCCGAHAVQNYDI